MYQDFQYYLYQLQNKVMIQEKKISELEKLIADLTDELKRLKEKPAIHVDKIEYSFDQLKVQTLEGTLNIGVNPADLQGIDSFEVNQAPELFDPKGLFRQTMKLEAEMEQQLETNLPQLIKNAEARVNQKLDKSYYDFIKVDIKKQIPSRIQYHLQQLSKGENRELNPEQLKQEIIERMLKEMENGICTFIKNLPIK
jgi:spore germination protein PC